MCKIQKFFIVLSIMLSVVTSIILSLYWKSYECALNAYHLPIPTAFVMEWRYVLAGLALILPFTVLIRWRKPEIVGSALFLGALVSSLSLLLFMVWAFSIPFSPLGICI